jgi:hypothetical protein
VYTAHKIDREMDKHRDREDFPLFYGTRDLQKVLARLPDGPEINKRIYGAITRSIEDGVRSAEEQISHTRHVLGLPDAAGLLVILNDSIDILDPQVAAHRVASLMKRTRSRLDKAATLDFACLIFESHSLSNSAALPVFPCVLIKGEGTAAKFPWFDTFFDRFAANWAAFNGVALVDNSAPRLDELKCTATSNLSTPQPTALRRQDIWRQQYDANPHLRGFPDTDLMQHGSRVLADLTPHFLKGTSGIPTEVPVRLLQEFTCFLQEVNHRGLDMRDVPRTAALNRPDAPPK